MNESNRTRQCFCATDIRDGSLEQCDQPAERMVWRSDGRVYYYCTKHAAQAGEYFPGAKVMDP